MYMLKYSDFMYYFTLLGIRGVTDDYGDEEEREKDCEI